MIPCDLIWYSDESYQQVMHRAVKLAKEHDQVVTIIDKVSGKPLTRVTPSTGFFERRRWK